MSLCASSPKCVSLNRLFGSRPQSNIVGAGFRRWYVSIEMRKVLVVVHGSSAFPLFCFRPLFGRCCYHAHQCVKWPSSQSFSFCLCWRMGTNSWPHCDKLVLLFSISTYCFRSFVLLVVSPKFFAHTPNICFLCHLFNAHWLSTGLDDVLSWLEQVEQRPSRALPRLGVTRDTSGDESNLGEPWRRLRWKKTYKMQKVWGTSDVGRFFVTGPTDVATKPSHFYCKICRKNGSELTHRHHEILRHFQGSKHFPRDQLLRLETPGWEMLDYEGFPWVKQK